MKPEFIDQTNALLVYLSQQYGVLFECRSSSQNPHRWEVVSELMEQEKASQLQQQIINSIIVQSRKETNKYRVLLTYPMATELFMIHFADLLNKIVPIIDENPQNTTQIIWEWGGDFTDWQQEGKALIIRAQFITLSTGYILQNEDSSHVPRIHRFKEQLIQKGFVIEHKYTKHYDAVQCFFSLQTYQVLLELSRKINNPSEDLVNQNDTESKVHSPNAKSSQVGIFKLKPSPTNEPLHTTNATNSIYN